MIRAEELHERILKELDMSREIDDDQLIELIHGVLEERGRETYIPLKEKATVGKELFNAFRKLDILQELIEDDTITEIMINGTEHIFIERKGRLEQLPKRFVSREKLEDVIQQMVADANRMVNEASPIVIISFGNFRMVTMGPFRAIGYNTTLTLEPSSNLASTMGEASFTMRLASATIC